MVHRPQRRPRECPLCHRAVGPEAPTFPFCCRRCRLIDLGRWLGGDYRFEVPLEGADREAPSDSVPHDFPADEGTP
ncbi:MAG: DNA gyrase inhibitor YacG [bacterium]